MPAATGFGLVAQMRAREFWTRIVIAAVIGLMAYGLTSTVWPAVWFAAVLIGQVADWWLVRPMRRDPDKPFSLGYRVVVCAFTSLNAFIYSGVSAYLWFSGGVVGQVFAVIHFAGGLLHVTLNMHQARPLLLSTMAPHAIYFLGLPLYSAFTGNPWMGVGVVGGILYLAHLVKAVSQAHQVTQELRDANAEASDARDRAERASAAKSDFLATVSHEIRTPMNAVISAAELLRRTALTPAQAEHVSMLLDAGDVLMGLLNDVLDLSKIEAGKMTLEAADVDLPQKLDALARLWEPRARDKGVELRVSLADDLPRRVRTDPLRLQQILFNLLSNGLKFTDQGKVELRAGVAGERLWFEVRDTGCGMAPEVLARIFAGFEQAEAGTTRRYGGSGLGLAISRRLAELMGGDLTAQSAPGEGSTFRLELPLQEAVAPAADVARCEGGDCDQGDLGELRVLLAEDHAVNRRIVALFLEPLGCRLTMAENGRLALDAAEAEAFDVIIMDMQMPVMDGLEAARAIRAGSGPNATTPIMALTANALDHHRAAWAQAGVETFLTKPIDPRALTAALLGAAGRAARPADCAQARASEAA